MQNHYSHLLMKHGIAAMLVALFAGFLLIFSLIGGMSLSPVPVLIEFDLPGTSKGWRIVHMGTLMNGMMAMIVGLVMRAFYLSEGQAFRVFASIAFAIWANFLFYVFGMLAPNRGLTLEANNFGEASIAGAIAFFPALLGAITTIYAFFVLFFAEPAQEKS